MKAGQRTGGGRQPRKALTAAFVRQVCEPGKYFDGNGLFLRVEANGTKYWVQRITIRGKRCEIGLGTPDLVSLADVRDKALENRRMVRAGGDPLQAKREAKGIMNFADAARAVYDLHRPTWKNDKHAAQFISTLETYVFPRLSQRKVTDINSGDVLAVLSPIWTDKPETAKRVCQRIGMVMKWCVAQGWRTDNPAENITKALPRHESIQNHRKALIYDDVKGCIQTVQNSGAGMLTKLALEFLVLTAGRSGEVRGAMWDEIDFGPVECANHANRANRAVWEIPATRMKAKKAHRVPLSDRAVEILHAAKNLTDGTGMVFPGTKIGKPLSDATLSKLVKKLGFDVDVHGFRTSFRTWAQEKTNFPHEVAESALAHVVKNKAEAAYARSDLFEKRREMMQAWADYIRR